jgi:hypothetical protein
MADAKKGRIARVVGGLFNGRANKVQEGKMFIYSFAPTVSQNGQKAQGFFLYYILYIFL